MSSYKSGSMGHSARWRFGRLFLPFGLGYLVSNIYRSINAVIAPRLTADLALSDSDLGTLTAVYLLAYALSQIPVGLLLDRYGPRRIVSSLLLISAAGSLLFARAESFALLAAGRALVGIGVSACLMGAFAAFRIWLEPDRLPFANGLQMVAGASGALFATYPIEWLLILTDWRGLFVGLAVTTVAIAGTVLAAAPEAPEQREPEQLTALFKGVREVLTSRAFWAVAPLAIAAQASFIGMSTLWAGPWSRLIAGATPSQTAGVLFAMSVAIIAGYFASGALATRAAKSGRHPLLVAGAGIALFVAVQAVLAFGPRHLPVLWWVLFGFFGAFSILPYAVLPRSFPARRSGRVVTSINVLVFTAAFIVQAGVGVVLDAAGEPRRGFVIAFLGLIGLQVVGLGNTVLRRATVIDTDRTKEHP